MQKLRKKRITGTPRSIPQAPGSVVRSLNSPERKGQCDGLSNLSQPLDAALTGLRGGSRAELESIRRKNFPIYVLNRRGRPLMPTTPRTARKLLATGGAYVVKRTPFVIQLTRSTGEAKQPIKLGVDSGYSHVGLSATTAGKELCSAEVALRSDMVKLNSERRMYRRTRRGRKTWYRQPRFLNRAKSQSWLAPSIQHKLDSHVKLVGRVNAILPITKVDIEVAAFDIQKIKNPEIEGVGYQQGEQLGFLNTREYVLYRDDHTCQQCHSKSGDRILETHHIISRQVGGDRPENQVTLCLTCHGQINKGKLKPSLKVSKGFKAEAFMTMVRWRLVDALRSQGYDTAHTYGYITKARRVGLGLEKSHANDAFVIADGNGQVRSAVRYQMKQVRKCNRKLFKGNRSQHRNTASRKKSRLALHLKKAATAAA